MARIGIFPFLGRGHLNPAAALGRELIARGHEVTAFHIAIAEAAVRSAGMKFSRIDTHDEPGDSERQAPQHHRLRCLDTSAAVARHAMLILREAPIALRDAKIDAVIVDQLDLAAGTVAEYLDLPFVSLSCSPPMYLDAVAPSPFFGWNPLVSGFGRVRNLVGNSLISWLAKPALDAINLQRRRWHLPRLSSVNDAFSKLALITQLPEALDFEQTARHPHLFHVGQLKDDRGGIDPFSRAFPWSKLNGKPLIYASMGTIRNNLPWVFKTIATACSAVDAQLVMSLGGGRLQPRDLEPLPGNPIVVSYAPQRALLHRSTLAVTCAGTNTTLDSVACGVPMVAIPVGEDQPGMGARIKRAGIGEVLQLRSLSVSRLRCTIQTVLREPRYFASVKVLQEDLNRISGVREAANIIERVFDFPESHRNSRLVATGSACPLEMQ